MNVLPFLIAGLAGALLMYAGDMLLYWSKTVSSSGIENAFKDSWSRS